MLLFAATVLAGSVMGLPQELETASGPPFSLSTALAKGPAVLVFWNSWLPGAAEFVPLLHEVDRAAATNGWSGAVVVFQDESDGWATSIGAGGAALPRALDRRGVLLRRFRVTRAPAVLVVGPDGAVLDRGGPDAGQVRALLEALAQRGRGAR
jgi:hypothetical protein